MEISTPKTVLLLPCSPQNVEDPTKFAELLDVPYLTQFHNKDEIYVLYDNELWKFESWGGGEGSGQVRLSPLGGSAKKLNSTGYKNPTIGKCKFFRKIPIGISFI